MTKELFLFILISSLCNACQVGDCGQAPDNLKYSLFAADLPQPVKYLTRLDLEGRNSRLYAVSAPYAVGHPSQTLVTLNGGKDWQVTRSVLPNINAMSSDIQRALAVTNSPVAYKVYPDELWRSNDNGLHWQKIAYVINGFSASQFAVNTAKSGHSRCKLHLAALQNADTIFATVSVEVMEPPDYQKIQATIALDQLYVSRDGGNSWALFKTNVTTDSPVGINTLNPQLLIAESLSGPVLSHDGGSTWTPVGEQETLAATAHVEGFPDSEQEIADLHRDVAETRLLQVGFRNSLEWRKLRVYQFLFDPSNSKVIYIAANKGLFTSQDSGLHWKRLSVGEGYSNHLDEVNSVAVDKGILFVGTSTGVYQSSDPGCHFIISLKGN